MFSDDDEDIYGSADDMSANPGSVSEILNMLNMQDEALVEVSQEDAASPPPSPNDPSSLPASPGVRALLARARASAERVPPLRSLVIRDNPEDLALLAAMPPNPVPVPPPGPLPVRRALVGFNASQGAQPANLVNSSRYACTVCYKQFTCARDLGGHLRADRNRCIPSVSQCVTLAPVVTKCEWCSHFYSTSAIKSHEKKCATRAAKDRATGARLISYPPDVIAMMLNGAPVIPSESFDWVDSIPWGDLKYFLHTLTPSSSVKLLWAIVQQVPKDLISSRKSTALKLHLMSCPMIFAPVPKEWESSVNLLIKSRCQRFMRGDFQALWSEAFANSENSSHSDRILPEGHDIAIGLSPSAVRRALKRAQAGQARSATQSLLNIPLLDASDPVIQTYLNNQYTPCYAPPPLHAAPDLDLDEYEWVVAMIEMDALSDDGTAAGEKYEISACLYV
jgi:hypothetical protein